MKHPFLIGVLLIVIFFYPFFLQGLVPLCCDNLTINIPGRLWLADAIARRELPLWNPHILSGMPMLADLNLGLLHPFSALYFLFSSVNALTWEIMLSYLITFMGMYVLIRSHSMSRQTGIFGAIVFTFSGTLTTIANNVSQLRVVSLMPWVLWSFSMYLRRGRLSQYLISVAFCTAQILSGHPQFTYYTGVLLVIIALTSGNKNRSSNIRRLCAVGLLSAALSSVQIIPFIELAVHSTRNTVNTVNASSGSFRLQNMLPMFLPSAIGDLSSGGAWANQGMLLGYIGIVPLMLLVFFRRSVMSLYRLWFVVALTALFASFGKASPVYWVLYYLLPGFGYFRTPSLLIVIFTFATSMIVSMHFESLVISSAKKYRTVCITVAVVLSIIGFFLQQSIVSSGILMVLKQASERFMFLRVEYMTTILQGISVNLYIYAGIAVVIGYFLRRGDRHRIRIVLVLLACCELLYFSPNSIVYPSLQHVKSAHDLAVGVTLPGGVVNRVLIDPSAIVNPKQREFPKYDYLDETKWQLFVGKPNITSLLYPHADGYSSMVLTSYHDFIDPQSTDPTGVNLQWNNRNVNELGITHVLKRSDTQPGALPEWIYNQSACPLFFAVTNVGCSGNHIRIITTSNNSSEIRSSFAEDVEIVMAETAYPGWLGSVDGVPEKIHVYKGVFRSVNVPKGEHVVRFYYSPLSFKVGLMVTLLGSVVFCALWINVLLKNIRLKQNSKDKVEA